MSINADREAAKPRWRVRVAVDALERLKRLAAAANLQPSQVMHFAIARLASGEPSELRKYLEEHAGEKLELERTFRPWVFDVPAVTIRNAEQLAKEFRVTRQTLVTLIIDRLTQGSDGGGRRAKKPDELDELLRIIYSSSPPSVRAAPGGLNPVEVVELSTA